VKLLLQYLGRYKGLVALVLLLAAIDQVLVNLIPYVFGHRIIDPLVNKVHYFREHGLRGKYFHGIATGLLIMIGMGLAALTANTFRMHMTNIIIRRLGADLYADVLRHILCLPYKDFEDQRSGEVLSVLQRARLDSENFIYRFVGVLFSLIIAIVVVTVVSFPLSPILPLIYFLSVILMAVVINYSSRKLKFIQKDILDETNSLIGSATESLRNMELVKSLGLIPQEIQRFNKINFGILGKELRKVRGIRSIHFFYGATILILQQGTIFLLLVFLFYDKLTVGQLIMMQLYYYTIFVTLSDLGSVIVFYRDAEGSLNNLKIILSKAVENQPVHPEKIGPIESLRFDKVYFQHQSAILPALEDISFEVEIGETIALVGPSGAGKTTLVKLLVGLYDPVTGKIYYNGRSHGKIDLSELRSQVGLVTQDTQLFSGTIKENLLFVNPEANDAMIDAALRIACCQSLLERATKGVDTRIGESGLKLSGGERQRLSIARSLLRKSNILIFDEATSSLDSLTEREIADTIRNITDRKQYITIMIAHRLSSIMFADRIYVLEKGRIIETGNHAKLLERKGLYYAMWRQQTGEQRNVLDVAEKINYE
jgi:ATP-binding cassette subfamily B protein